MERSQGPSFSIACLTARRKISFVRWTLSCKLLAASVLMFVSVCLYLGFQAPQECPPCSLPGGNLPYVEKQVPDSHKRLVGGPSPEVSGGHPAGARSESRGPDATSTVAAAVEAGGSQTKQADSQAADTAAAVGGVVLIKKEQAEALKKLEPVKAQGTKRKFRNPPVPERPVISDEEQAKHKLAIIIPYRDRMENLQVFMPTMTKILQAQQVKFAVYVVEQTALGAFNRGKLCNIGFMIAEKDGYDYIAIHDVDKLPVSANVSYRWPGETFVHMATCVEQFKYELPYYNFLGGVVMFRMDHYRKLNGMTNIFWGFGAEDDDLWVRIKRRRLRISRAKECDKGRFVSLNHGNSSLYYPKVDYIVNYNLYRQLLKRKRAMENDGLSTLVYKLIQRSTGLLGYVNLTVDICQGALGRASIEETGCDGPKPRPGS